MITKKSKIETFLDTLSESGLSYMFLRRTYDISEVIFFIYGEKNGGILFTFGDQNLGYTYVDKDATLYTFDDSFKKGFPLIFIKSSVFIESMSPFFINFSKLVNQGLACYNIGDHIQ